MALFYFKEKQELTFAKLCRNGYFCVLRRHFEGVILGKRAGEKTKEMTEIQTVTKKVQL